MIRFLNYISIVFRKAASAFDLSLFTALFLSGSAPLSAQFGNAIASDGDALFPAIAIASKAALVSTLYSGAPAGIVACSWFLPFELKT